MPAHKRSLNCHDMKAFGGKAETYQHKGPAECGLIGQKTFNQLSDEYQKPQGREDRQEVNYDNDSSGWVRGHGDPYPNFDRGNAWRGKKLP